MSAVSKSPSRFILKQPLVRKASVRYAPIALEPEAIPNGGVETSKEPRPSTNYSTAHGFPTTVTSYHWDTAAPTNSQLSLAQKFFLRFPPTLLYSTGKFRTVNVSEVPEVAFLGRSNVGKSSLLNALMGRNICHTSSKPGRTRTMNFFAVGGDDGLGKPGKLTVLDMPGYGKGSRAEWGPEIMKYLVGRKQLKRAFLLIDAVHGLKRSDEDLMGLLRENAISHQIILSKVDRVLLPGPRKRIPTENKRQRASDRLRELFEDIRAKIQPGNKDRPEALGEIIACSGERSFKPHGQKLGINNVRWAVLAATGLGDQVRRVSPSEFLTPATEQEIDYSTMSDDKRLEHPSLD